MNLSNNNINNICVGLTYTLAELNPEENEQVSSVCPLVSCKVPDMNSSAKHVILFISHKNQNGCHTNYALNNCAKHFKSLEPNKDREVEET